MRFAAEALIGAFCRICAQQTIRAISIRGGFY
jgi:hypothetical protein